jgi:hypothetical protein
MKVDRSLKWSEVDPKGVKYESFYCNCPCGCEALINNHPDSGNPADFCSEPRGCGEIVCPECRGAYENPVACCHKEES